ncbi:MAG: glycosyltransferase [Myxococcota bacterium]|nr:glycosyltransferase [Myxococcota bacterium]
MQRSTTGSSTAGPEVHTPPGGPTLSAIVPARNARAELAETLPPLLDRVGDGLLEVIVVDDASTDGSGALAERMGAEVVRNEVRTGPAGARNRGAERARGEVLLFVDADVRIHDDAVERLRRGLREDAADAVYGSYDDRPPVRTFASQYMNLRHHFVHQRQAGAVSTFWAGCGAVRADLFRQVGGFDAESFPEPSVEDIELGYRLGAAGGRIRLDPGMLGTHLKAWTLRQVLFTDVVRRALPWCRLLAARPEVADELNASRRERWAAVVAWAFWASVALAVAGLPPIVALACFALAAAVNRELLGVFARRGGWQLALPALVMHQLYYLYATSILAYCLAEHRLRSAFAARDAAP